jgi:N utilization substance protein A
MMAINQVCAERKLAREVVLEAVEAALISAYKRNFGAVTNIVVQIDPNTGAVRVFAEKEVVDRVEDSKAQVSLAEAIALDPKAELGQTVLVENTPKDFGRIAAQTAKQVILQRIREAERDALYSSYADSAGEIANGTIQSIDFQSNDVMVNLDGAEAILPAREQVSTERYRRGARLRAYVIDVRKGSRGPQITLSRRNPALLRRLLELEVPEIYSGVVEIKSIAREPGSRSKVAVHATQEGVDPVGSCVGVRGGRIQNVVNELNGEKIDVVQWSTDMAAFIANALSPAKVMNVILDDSPDSGKTATVIVPDRQLSLAIGKEGQNARLAAKLTGWRIDIKSATEAAEETLGRFEGPIVTPGETALLVLAEALLRKRGTGTLTPAEREVVAQEVSAAQGADLDWPEEEPVIPADSPAEPVIPAEPRPAVAAPVPAPAAISPAAGLPVEPEEALEERTPEEAEAAAEIRRFDESDLVPTFEGPPIEDSLGWITPETVEEPLPEGEIAALAPEWVEDEEWEELPTPGPKKKKAKKGGRGRWTDNIEDQWQYGGIGRIQNQKNKPGPQRRR